MVSAHWVRKDDRVKPKFKIMKWRPRGAAGFGAISQIRILSSTGAATIMCGMER